MTVIQQRLDEVATALAAIAEVLEVFGVSGAADLLVRVAARDADDLYGTRAPTPPTRASKPTKTPRSIGPR